MTKTDRFVDIDGLLQMVDEIPPQSVVVMVAEGGIGAASWGGLLSAAAQARGALGAIVDGSVRDAEQISRLGFPVFARSFNMRDVRRRGELSEYDCDVMFGDVRITPGDYIMADANGVIVIPLDRIEVVLDTAEEWRRDEAATESALREGQSASAVYKTFGRI
jgi:regulator of RNase E activity RraA